jgi:hypothetical protein
MNRQVDAVESDKPLLVFPPNMSRFLLVTLALMVAHGLSVAVAVIYLSDLDHKLAIPISVITVLIFVLMNILVTRGINLGVVGLKVLAITYFVLSVASLIFSANVILCLVSGGCALVGFIVIYSNGYKDYFRFMEESRSLRKRKVTY